MKWGTRLLDVEAALLDSYWNLEIPDVSRLKAYSLL